MGVSYLCMYEIWDVCIYIYEQLYIYISPFTWYVHTHIHVDIDSNANGSVLDSGLKGLPLLILMPMAENFLRLYKVLWVRLKWVAMQSQDLMLPEQS